MAAAPGKPAMYAALEPVVRLFFAGVEQHDDEDEQDHDGAGVDDDLGGGEELGAERPVEDRERHHDDDEGQGAVNGVALQQEIECRADGEQAKDEEEGELHGVAAASFRGVWNRSLELALG